MVLSDCYHGLISSLVGDAHLGDPRRARALHHQPLL